MLDNPGSDEAKSLKLAELIDNYENARV